MAAIVLPLAGFWWPRSAFSLALGATLLATAASGLALAAVLRTGPMSYHVGGWEPPLGIEYVADHVSAFVALVVTAIASVVLVATRRPTSKTAFDRKGTFYSVVMLLLTGLTGIVMTGDLFNLFVFLEISSLAAYALIFLGGRPAMLAGFRYLILGTIGGSFYLLGVGFLYFSTGTLNMVETQLILTGAETSRSVQAGAIFIFTGLALKMGLVPLHLWLPDSYTYSPSAVSSLIAPIMTKVSAYAMLRMFLSVFPEGYLTDVAPVGPALLVLGLGGTVLGSLAAFLQTDFRRMLAYSSIGQVGLIAVGIGLATPLGSAAALLHIMNHAVMKACLFLVAANIRFRTGNSDLAGMAGLGRTMPITMACFIVAALAMVGVPPLVGFFSKVYLVLAGIGAGNWLVLAIVLFSGLLTAAYMFRVIERAYLAQPSLSVDPAREMVTVRESTVGAAWNPDVPREAPPDMLLPTVLLAVATLVLGLASGTVLVHVLEPGILMAQER